MSMELFEAIMTRRSGRRYLDRQVERGILERVVEAGRLAPSGGNSQTTRFIVITKRAVLDALAELVEREFAAMEVQPDTYKSLKNSILASKRGGYVFHYNAPALIVTANKKNYGNNIADCACALENMMLAANALDLASCWINQLHWLTDHPAVEAVMRALGMAEDECVCGALAVGWPDTEDGLPPRAALAHNGNPVEWH